MAVICKSIWCGPCATKLGVPFVSEWKEVRASRWGIVGLPRLRCACCRRRMRRGEVAVGLSAYNKSSDYLPWETEFLCDLDAYQEDQGAPWDLGK